MRNIVRAFVIAFGIVWMCVYIQAWKDGVRIVKITDTEIVFSDGNTITEEEVCR
jgi:uncharacterized protein (DUF4213/DUF364 family)